MESQFDSVYPTLMTMRSMMDGKGRIQMVLSHVLSDHDVGLFGLYRWEVNQTWATENYPVYTFTYVG